MNTKTVKTNWIKATTDPRKAMAGLMVCLETRKNAWSEVRENGDQEYPIMMVSPELNNPFNWTMAYGTYGKVTGIEMRFCNETEQSLFYDWIYGYGTKEAVELYQKDGTIMEGLLLGCDIGTPVRRKDAQSYRDQYIKDGYIYKKPSTDDATWHTIWKPKDGIKAKIVDPSVGKVFTICYDDGDFDRVNCMRRASEFFHEVAEAEALSQKIRKGVPN
ncbi:MAG: hypothetical protein LUE86_10550 [Clostridiales bacterium]|nr:hypothetical protein [Clostridiales bacterium]